MADEGTRLTDKAVSQVERRIRKVYKEAERDIAKKMSEFTAKHAAKDAQMRAKLAAGEITKEEYQRWQRGQVFIGKQWEAKRDSIADTLYHANQTAQAIVNEKARGVFATNFNYQNFELEKTAGIEMGFGLYDNAAVGRLIRERPRLLPQPKVSKPKDVRWNQRNIANSITQSIIQGESIPEAAKRLAQTTGSTNMKAMRMHTRTALTGAQNAGRIEAMHEQQEMGIEVKKKWIATLDDRTRDTHGELDGQVVDVDEPFRVDGMEIMEPGDPSAPPELVYNCRCTLGYVYPKYEHLVNHDRRAKNENGEYEQVGDVTFKEWQEGKRGNSANTVTEEQAPQLSPEEKARIDFDGGDDYLKQAYEEREAYRQDLEAARQAWIDSDEAEHAIRRDMLRLDSTAPDYQDRYDDLAGQLRSQKATTSAAYDRYRDKQRNMPYNAADMAETAKKFGIDYNVPSKLEDGAATWEEIAADVAGGDKTRGSCASLGFCYVGQSEGYEVLDFRDGESRAMFAQNCESVLRGISKETGKPLYQEATKTGTGGAVKLLKKCEPGHEYYFVCGRHAAIVRVEEKSYGNAFQYFEMQSSARNGWKFGGDLEDRKSLDYTFKHRFGCSGSITGGAMMMDVEDMKGSKLLHRVLGYINTAIDKQVKGATGHER